MTSFRRNYKLAHHPLACSVVGRRTQLPLLQRAGKKGQQERSQGGGQEEEGWIATASHEQSQVLCMSQVWTLCRSVSKQEEEVGCCFRKHGGVSLEV